MDILIETRAHRQYLKRKLKYQKPKEQNNSKTQVNRHTQQISVLNPSCDQSNEIYQHIYLIKIE